MSYDELAERLAADDRERRVAAFPDGSVDDYYAAFDAAGERIAEREAFGDRIASGDSDAVPIEREAREPGGQAVNAARQVHALGDDPTLYGHLEDPVFEALPFEATSMGDPSRVSVFPFDDDALLFAERSSDVANWSLGDLEAAAPSGDAVEALAADAVCCGNWASIDGLTDALETLAAGSLAAGTFVLDPGPVRTRSHGAVTDLLEALGELDETAAVVYSVNRSELEYTAAAIGADSDASGVDADLERLESVREMAGITAAVLHETEHAAVATRAETTVVENVSVDDPRRRTGAGDRFGAGLAVARARNWDWETALALGNCAASYYVATGETGTRDELRSFLDD
ncbi:hypothetical protein HT576_00580 [Haloterrigena sp. SYSU A121-1]|uniref:Carbohydrate kinase PfkB domain-containing protein n=1 Tax=Haloterrigena gelatinilytica TaxID=2741724 RepID=A0A8J8GGK1_9EURY|nr:PfkB family carbohydrate kinase [Haloterrigena gelatinilytica]NUB89528.1 hypothetical protein [Haloterrigena gelatinilytica]